MSELRDVNIVSKEVLTAPGKIRNEELPISKEFAERVDTARHAIANILEGKDNRMLFVVGPCSIHDPEAAIEYAQKLKKLSTEIEDKIFIVMRVYFEKPRTSVGWKGLINDPDLNDSFNVEKGMRLARSLMLQITEIGMPIGTEALDPISPQYLDDLVSWCAIGARTVESQTHREMASGLSAPVGFKNGTDGSLDVMVNALKAVNEPHAFLGVNRDGRCAVFRTSGNQAAHGILRGGGGQPNYDSDTIASCTEKLEAAGLHSKIMVDCSHGNSNKDHNRQKEVLKEIIAQREAGNSSICGVMIESNLFEGKQKLDNKEDLQYGVSVTDACIGWEETEQLLREVAEKL